MIGQIEKLGLTVKQYSVLGKLMMAFCMSLSVGAFFLADKSLALGIVLALISIEFGFVGYCFLKFSGKLLSSDDQQLLDNHRQSHRSRRNMTSVSIFTAIIFISCLICIVVVVCAAPAKEAVVDEVVASTQIEQTQADETLTQAPEDEEQNDIVYATASGERYHFSAKCAGDTCFAITMQEALDHSLTPCKRCVSK